MLRDRVVAEIADDSVRQKPLQEKGLTLKTRTDFCRVHEVSTQQAKTMATEEMHHVQANNKGSKAGTTSMKGSTDNSLKGKQCSFCERSHQKVGNEESLR